MKSLREQDRTFGPVFLKGVVVLTNSTSQQNRNFGIRRTNLFFINFFFPFLYFLHPFLLCHCQNSGHLLNMYFQFLARKKLDGYI